MGDDVKAVDESLQTLQVRFTTKQQEYAIPDYPCNLPATVGSEALNNFVNKILVESNIIDKPKSFDFLAAGEFLRGTLEELVLRQEALKSDGSSENQQAPVLGTEEIFTVEYVERWPSPEPKDCLMHDDWVSAIDATQKWILSGCYDSTLHLWTIKGKHKQAFAAHDGPVKRVCWIRCDDSSAVFASASHDETVMIWEWDLENNNASCKWICKGHVRSVEALKVHPESSRMASGSWDGLLKIWSASTEVEKSDTNAEEPEGAIGGAPPKPRIRTPIVTLAGHRESVSAVAWTGPQEIITTSWDHTIKIWDLDAGAIKTDLVGNKAFFDMSWSDLNHTIITASADRHIRLYDPRSSEGSIVKSMFTSHSGWVSSVNWSTTEENLFISGSHDNLMKLWDQRSPRTPLYNLTGHTENILCTNWSNPQYLLSGGSDNTLRIFKAKSDE